MRSEVLLSFYKVLFARIFLADQVPVAVERPNLLHDRQRVLQHIMDQMNRKLAEKRGWRKPMKSAIERALNNLSYLLSKSYSIQLPQCSGPKPDLGKDGFGRDVATNVRAYVRLLKDRRVKLHTVLVLGSRTKGRWSSRSDIDIVVVADDLPESPHERWFYVRDSPINMSADISACSRAQFLRHLEEFRILPLDAICYGIVVFDDGFWSKVNDRFGELEKEYGLERSQLRRILEHS